MMPETREILEDEIDMRDDVVAEADTGATIVKDTVDEDEDFEEEVMLEDDNGEDTNVVGW